MNRISHSCKPHMSGVACCQHQGGAVLFVALITLFIASIIVVSGVRSVVMEQTMASNSQYEMLVFQAAETAIEGVLADDAAFVAAINTPVGDALPTRNFTVGHTDNHFAITSDATISVAPGRPGIPLGYSIGDFGDYQFTIISTGEIASINATATHTQTASKIAPYLGPPLGPPPVSP